MAIGLYHPGPLASMDAAAFFVAGRPSGCSLLERDRGDNVKWNFDIPAGVANLFVVIENWHDEVFW
jgi:hypothetical protein